MVRAGELANHHLATDEARMTALEHLIDDIARDLPIAYAVAERGPVYIGQPFSNDRNSLIIRGTYPWYYCEGCGALRCECRCTRPKPPVEWDEEARTA